MKDIERYKDKVRRIKYLEEWQEKNKERCKKVAEEYRLNHKEEIVIRGKKYYEKNRTKILEKSKNHHQKNKHNLRYVEIRKKYIQEHKEEKKKYNKEYDSKRIEIKREHNLLREYGITIKDYNDLFIKQNGKCAICGNLPNKRGLFVDHDHETGKIRGLLCHNCNIGLGMFYDNNILLQNATKYLEEI